MSESIDEYPWPQFTKEECEHIQQQLNRKLTIHEIKHRFAFNGVRLAYIEGWKAYSNANEIFGFNGWSSEIISMEVDYVDVNDGRYSVGVTCHVRVYLKDNTFHDDVGYGSSENMKSKSEALGKARKEAVTDATKRALRIFGNRLGNCMYDRDFLKSVYNPCHQKQRVQSIVNTSHSYGILNQSNNENMTLSEQAKQHSRPPQIVAEDAYEEEGFIEDASLLEAIYDDNFSTSADHSKIFPWQRVNEKFR